MAVQEYIYIRLDRTCTTSIPSLVKFEYYQFDMSEHTYKFDVKMTCGGCSGAITRALNKARENNEVSSFDVSLEKQEVVVKSELGYDTILEKIKKTGKEVRSGVTIQ